MGGITKIIARVLDRKGENGANCKVLQFTRDGRIVNERNIIIQTFPPRGHIFSSKIFEYGKDVVKEDVIEIELPDQKIEKPSTDDKNPYILLEGVKKVGVRLIHIHFDEINGYVDQKFIDLDRITLGVFDNNPYPKTFSKIYLYNEQYVIGPFKVENSSIVPAVGKEANVYEYDSNEIIGDIEYRYILREPSKKLAVIDCSTPSQLVEFLKDRITIERSDLNLLNRIREQIHSINNSYVDLDAIRLKRAEKYLEQLSLAFDQLKSLYKNEKWAAVVKNTVEQYKKEFETELKLELQHELNALQEKKDLANDELSKISASLREGQHKLKQIEQQLETIELKKEEIITSIKIMADLQSAPNISKREYHTNQVEFINWGRSPEYTDPLEFYEYLKDTHNIRIQNQNIYEDGLFLLKENRFLLAKNMIYVLNLLAQLGNAKIAIHHAEADWLKFKYWQENGLEIVIKQAENDSSNRYFYILQDFNIASIECYGKPILNIADKVRRTIDGIQTIPPNMTFILVRTDEEIDDFGFELNASTFQNWKCLPDFVPQVLINIPSKDALDLKNLIVGRQANDYRTQYF